MIAVLDSIVAALRRTSARALEVALLAVLGASVGLTTVVVVRHQLRTPRPATPTGRPVPYIHTVGQCLAVDLQHECLLRYVPIEGQGCLVARGGDHGGGGVAVDCWARE